MKYLIGIGIEKCGTSSIFSMLNNSPLFNTSIKKETFFFNKNYSENIEHYLKLFKQDPRKFKGYSVDITPSYFRNKKALTRIRDLNSEKKCLIMLRDPIERAYSHYVHDVVNHFSTGQKSQNFSTFKPTSFEQLIWQRPDYYLPKYSDLVTTALDIFGREHVHIIKLDELMQFPGHTLGKFFHFLGFENIPIHDVKLPHTNERKVIPQIVAHWKRANGLYSIVQQVSDKETQLYDDISFEQLNNALRQQEQYTLSVEPLVIEKIQQYYLDDLANLNKLTGLRFESNIHNYALASSFCSPDYKSIVEASKYLHTNKSHSDRAAISIGLTVKKVTLKTSNLVNFLKAPDRLGRLRRNRKRNLKSQTLRNTVDYSAQGQWPKSPELQPWFDQPNARDIIAERNISEQDKALLYQWVEEGFIIADILDSETCDNLKKVIEYDVWRGEKRFPNLEIIGLRQQHEEKARKLTQIELLSLPERERQWMQFNNNWRIHGMDEYSEHFEKVTENANVIRIASLLFGCPAETGFTLSFGVGSQQSLHQDYAQFHIYPRNYLIGCWIALEDIHPNSGPLEFYPRTHKLGYWAEHDKNYPQINLRTSTHEKNAQYFSWLKAEANKISQREELIIKKGQALFWHACLAHGGSIRKDMRLSRHSVVLHLTPKGMDVDKRFIVETKIRS
ncbi:phytanoyl-CoA dioxygenase family protein [Alteromonas facilis]|uniref:phytanoyl-CoA dioxygenase family protein n=1 Tax=Alteromonas facilis TaxID=2048004 RepID=UPI000C294926|nr:phytanoyl-CoA dioxygenase family protein [Alteromonas facilis]